MVFSYDSAKEDNMIADLLEGLRTSGISFKDLHTKQSSLEDIFVSLVKQA